ncbi:unnamed protein product [Paramecium pentaurelia]|uniref:FHA domain-containing protein n=1 Tax=Paramecium pentaurelia TaxID=43138 RepID=A0A8S1XT80_9CILI|nr:unnamed protein product [Paramecium pentaurelia]
MGEQISKGSCNCADTPQYLNTSNYDNIINHQQTISHFDIINTNRNDQLTEKKHPQSILTDLQQTKKISSFQHQEQQRKTPILILRVIASATLEENQIFEFQPNNQSNVIYFGCKHKNKKGGYKINDYKIPSIDNKLNKKNRGQHFYIKYDYQNQNFRIKDLGIGFGCFYKVNEIKLQNNTLITMGQMYFTTQICYGQDLLRLPSFNNLYDVKEFIVSGYPCDRQYFLSLERDQWYLRIQLYGGTAKDDVYILSSKNYLPVTIGRNIDCLIRYYDDVLLSKYQCTVLFDGQWKIIDGIEGKSSTNGTWLYLKDEQILTENMLLKTNNTILEVNFK